MGLSFGPYFTGHSGNSFAAALDYRRPAGLQWVISGRNRAWHTVAQWQTRKTQWVPGHGASGKQGGQSTSLPQRPRVQRLHLDTGSSWLRSPSPDTTQRQPRTAEGLRPSSENDSHCGAINFSYDSQGSGLHMPFCLNLTTASHSTIDN